MLIEETDRRLWDTFDTSLDSDPQIANIFEQEKEILFEEIDAGGQSWSLPIRKKIAYVVGVDIQGYSRRSNCGQLTLTAILSLRHGMSYSLLRQLNWIGSNEPQISIPTGDGALILFESWPNALAYILAMQWHLETVNRNIDRSFNWRTQCDSQYNLLPIHVRFALAKGNVMIFNDPNCLWNAVGNGMVTCARLLAASSGHHFFIDADCMNEIMQQGGINDVSQSIPSLNWEQSFHTALLPEKKIKSGTFSFYNVFGTYSNKNALLAIPQPSVEPITIEIGSHDVSTIK
jgi:hypothetical protein